MSTSRGKRAEAREEQEKREMNTEDMNSIDLHKYGHMVHMRADLVEKLAKLWDENGNFSVLTDGAGTFVWRVSGYQNGGEWYCREGAATSVENAIEIAQ